MDSYSNNRPRFDLYEDSIKRAKEKEKQEELAQPSMVTNESSTTHLHNLLTLKNLVLKKILKKGLML